jgi:hypothetical protein
MAEEVLSLPQFIQNIRYGMPKILIINYNEKREVIVSLLKRFTNKYIRKEKILSEIENMIKTEKPDIVAFFTQESVSGTKYHYQHQLIEKIEGIKNTQLEYRIVSKVDATTKKNSNNGVYRSNDKKPFNVRTRIYINNKTVYFGFSNTNFSKSVSEGISNNSILNEKESNKSKYNKEINKQKFKFIKYGYRRLRFSREGKGYILSNMIIERNDQTQNSTRHQNYNKHNYIFCNYDTHDENILEKIIMQKNIKLDIDLSIYLITKNYIKNIEFNKDNGHYSTKILVEGNNSQKIEKYKINGESIVKNSKGTLDFLKLNGSKFKNILKVNNTKNINTKNKYLVLISDIEGCSANGQSRILCSNDFFDSLDKFLLSGNSVAFLGDYFDKGDLVEFTINRIIELYEKYNINLKGNGFGKVHIILGNRDLNKLRIPYEVQDDIVKPTNTSSGLWPIWGQFYSIFTSNTSNKKKLVEDILEKSMGASGSYDWIAPLLNIDNDYSFKENLRKLFSYGKIVIYDEEFKILLSHSGGDMNIFFNYKKVKDNYDSILKLVNEKINININIFKYFEYIEFSRNQLMSYNSVNDGDTNLKGNIEINEFIDSINNILDKVRVATKDYTQFSKTTLIPEYFLIQAMGLKPNVLRNGMNQTKIIGEQKFLSFIESRDHNGCSGPKIYKDTLLHKYKKSLRLLKKLGVNFVASGHVPHCAPVPLIYRRDGCENVAFILNDTSNGYRKENINTVNKLPLSFVRSNKTNQNTVYSTGVGFLDNNKISTNLPSNGIPLSLDNFSFMIGEWNIDNMNDNNFPYFEGTLYNGYNSYVKYPFGTLRFTTEKNGNKNLFSPANGVKNNI